MATNVRARGRYTRYSQFRRIRYRTDQLARYAANSTRLASSRTSHTVAPVHVANTDATGLLTIGGQPTATQTVTIGDIIYTFVAALTEAKATATYTVGGGGSVIQDGNTLTINGKVYTWQTSLTNVDGHVLIGANDTAALLNMLRAITLGTASGTSYAAATTAHPTVTATSSNATTLVITALLVGVAGNALTLAESSSGAWGSSTTVLTGGVAAVAYEILIDDTAAHTRDNLKNAVTGDAGLYTNRGTKYSTGTVLNAAASAAASGANMTVTALAHGTSGDSVVTSETASNYSFGDTHLTGGVTETWGPTWTATSHGQADLAGPYQLATATALPTGTNTTELYWIKKVDANVIKLALSRADVIAGAFVQTTDAGTGAHTLKRAIGNEAFFEMTRRNKPEAILAATDIDNLV